MVQFVEGPQHGHGVLDAVSPVKPEVVRQQRHEDHRDDFQGTARDGYRGEIMECDRQRLPGQVRAESGAPYPGQDTQRQSQVRRSQRNDDVHTVIAPPRSLMHRPDLFGDDERDQGRNGPVEQVGEHAFDRAEEYLHETHRRLAMVVRYCVPGHIATEFRDGTLTSRHNPTYQVKARSALTPAPSSAVSSSLGSTSSEKLCNGLILTMLSICARKSCTSRKPTL